MLEHFFEMHCRLDHRMRQCITEYWERCNADDPLAGLSPRQINYLCLINRHGSCSLRTVMQHTGLSASAASTAVEKLVRLGIVRRETDPEDRRNIRISMEPSIRASIDEIEQEFRLKIIQMLASCGEEELKTVEAAGVILCRALREEEERTS